MTEQERNVMQQALDALCLPCDRWNGVQAKIVNEAIEALRATLAAPAVADDALVGEGDKDADHAAMQAAWATLRPQLGTAGWTASESFTYHGFFGWGWEARRQYAAPQPTQVEPLTDEQINQAVCKDAKSFWNLHALWIVAIARAVEAAHGIGGVRS